MHISVGIFRPKFAVPFLTNHSRKNLVPHSTSKRPNLKNIPNSSLECKHSTLFVTKIAKLDTQFMTKTAEKPYPLGRT